MDYLLYILAGFGIFSLLVLFVKLIVWGLNCDIDRQFVPIGDSEVYTMKESLTILNANEAIEEMDKMLDQYTKPKVVISRQCICPFCTKESDKIIINNIGNNIIDNTIDECDDNSFQSVSSRSDSEEVKSDNDDDEDIPNNNNYYDSDGLIPDIMVTIDDDETKPVAASGGGVSKRVVNLEEVIIRNKSSSREALPCSVYNNVVTELKTRFGSFIDKHRQRNNTMIVPTDPPVVVIYDNNSVDEVIVESTNL
ncbi:uncharacterized protein LOC128951297 [Oppia nitens]|uniref:uncharacterized protein LOC128951297 n=1 Tax=Oppia nitens TaxID=1686743 RepID=UPI0023DCB794|nr:uncharacterized protein LOC128951297 [Oppia nitens]